MLHQTLARFKGPLRAEAKESGTGTERRDGERENEGWKGR